MVLDSVSFLKHDYLLVSHKTASYKIKLRIVKVARGASYSNKGKDNKETEVLYEEEKISAYNKYQNQLNEEISRFKDMLTHIVLNEAVIAFNESSIVINEMERRNVK